MARTKKSSFKYDPYEVSSPFAKYNLGLVGCLFVMRGGGLKKFPPECVITIWKLPVVLIRRNGTYYVSVIIT